MRKNSKTPDELEPCYLRLGGRIVMRRKLLGMTQDTLAEAVGLDRSSIANLEAGRQRVPLHKVEMIAYALGTKPQYLVRGIWI